MKDDTSTPITDSGASPNEFESDKPETSARTLSEGGIETLRAAGGVFVNAVRATRMPMVLTDPTLAGNPIVFANAAFLKLSGYSMEEVLGQQPHFMDGPDTDPRDEARFREMVRSDQDEILETIQYRKSGERFVATVLISAFKDDAGRTLHHFMSWLDVTRRVDAEEEVADLKSTQAALRESEIRHRLLVDSWAQAIWETDSEGVVVKDSPSWRAYTGQTFEEWLGYGWLDAIHPDDREYAGRQWRDAVAAKSLVDGEFRMRAPDGTWRWTNVRAAPVLDARGAVEKWAGMNMDIETRKRAERALSESETKFRAVFETMNEACCIFDMIYDDHGRPVDWRILEANPGYEKQSGLKNVTGRLASEFMPGTEPYWIEMFGRVVESGKGEHIEKWHEPTGRWIHSSTARVGGPGSRRLASVFFDITERKRAEFALRESEEKYRSLFNNLNDGFAVLRVVRGDDGEVADMAYVALNDAAERQTGIDRAQFIGRRLSEVSTKQDFERWMPIHRRVADTGQPASLEECVEATDRWYDLTFYRSAEDEVSVFIRDIDERKRAEEALRESEERFRTMADNAPVLIWETDQEGATSVNAHYLDFFGVGIEQVLGMGWSRFLHPDDAEGYAKVYRHAFEHRLPYSYDARFRRGDGKYRWLRNTGGPVADNRFIGCSLDVTDMLVAQQSLRESEERQTFLLKLSDVVRPLVDAAEIQGEAARLLREQLNAGWCYYVDWDLDKKTGLVLRDSTREGLPSLAGEHDVSDVPEFLQLLAEGAVLTAPDYASYEMLSTGIRQNFTALGFRSMMAAPLVKEGRLIASLLVGDTDTRDWSANDESLLVEVAERTWAAVERARAEAALRESEERLAADLKGAESLQALSGQLIKESGDKFYERIVDTAMAIMGAEFGSIQLLDEKEKVLRLIAWRNFHPEAAEYWQNVSVSTGSACGSALQHGDRVIIPDVGEDEHMRGIETLRCYEISNIKAVQSTPLTTRDGRVIGMISTHWRESYVPQARELRLFDVLVRQASDFIERKGVEEALRESEERLREREADLSRVQRVGGVGGIDIDVTGGLRGRRSPEYMRLHGLSPEQAEETHEDWLARVHPDDRHQAEHAMFEALNGDASSYENEYRIIRPSDGQTRWIHARADIERNAKGKAVRIVGAHLDVTEIKQVSEALKASERHAQILLGELQHRVRNTLAVVRSIARRTADRSETLDEMVSHFEGRLNAFSRVQSAVTRNPEAGLSLDAIVEDELISIAAREGEQFRISGPEVSLRARPAESISLAIHELATNAVKYGALTSRDGRIKVSWDVRQADAGRQELWLEWVESGLDRKPAESHEGFGHEMLRRSLPYDLGAETDIRFTDDGMRFTMVMPLGPEVLTKGRA